MRLWSNASFAALLLGSTVATSALAATPYTGCPAGYHRAEGEGGGGVGSVSLNTRKADGEGGGGVGSVNLNTRKADGEGGGGVGSVSLNTRKADGEGGGGVGSVNLNTRRAEAMADLPCIENSH